VQPALYIESAINGILLGTIFSLLGVGFSLNWGSMKVLNISHATFAVLGAYIVYWCYTLYGVDPIVMIPVVGILLFALGALIYKLVVRPVMRARDVVMGSLVATFGIVYIGVNLMSLAWQPDPRVLRLSYATRSINVLSVLIPSSRLIGFVIALGGIVALFLFLHKTFTGKAVRATWQNPTGAALVGINPERVSLITFGLSLASAGIAGVAMALNYSFYPPIEAHWMLYVFLVTIIGGVGSLLGASGAGFIIGLISGLGAMVMPAIWVNVLLFVFLFLVVLLRPQGLFKR
jgi:branched-chain amino acid transport system permease protein